MPGDSLGNTSGAERGSEDEVRSEIMEEPGRPPTLARSHRRTKTNYADGLAELAVQFLGFSRDPYRCATSAQLSDYGPMIDVKLCKICRARAEHAFLSCARGTVLLFMESTDKELKATADKLADIIHGDRSVSAEEQKTIPLTIDGDSSEKRKYRLYTPLARPAIY